MNKFKFWHNLFCQNPTPICQLKNATGVNIYVKRDDLNHSTIQGNKLRKLKYNIKYALDNNINTIATFGGAYSNHISATASAAHLCQLKSVGFIRGDELQTQQNKWSPTLIEAHLNGMEFVFLSRSEYKLKFEAEKVKHKLAEFSGNVYTIPEGGSNKLAVKGVVEIIDELKLQIAAPDYIMTACGTGGTLAGLINGASMTHWETHLLGVAVLRNAEFLKEEITHLIEEHNHQKWHINLDYHFSGYAKSNTKLYEFCKSFYQTYGFKLDKIYNAKSFFAAFDLIKKKQIQPGKTLVILHTGGLQGGSF